MLTYSTAYTFQGTYHSPYFVCWRYPAFLTSSPSPIRRNPRSHSTRTKLYLSTALRPYSLSVSWVLNIKELFSRSFLPWQLNSWHKIFHIHSPYFVILINYNLGSISYISKSIHSTLFAPDCAICFAFVVSFPSPILIASLANSGPHCI
jgi:hypothetical protein